MTRTVPLRKLCAPGRTGQSAWGRFVEGEVWLEQGALQWRLCVGVLKSWAGPEHVREEGVLGENSVLMHSCVLALPACAVPAASLEGGAGSGLGPSACLPHGQRTWVPRVVLSLGSS